MDKHILHARFFHNDNTQYFQVIQHISYCKDIMCVSLQNLGLFFLGYDEYSTNTMHPRNQAISFLQLDLSLLVLIFHANFDFQQVKIQSFVLSQETPFSAW